jgi:hypothetical protein
MRALEPAFRPSRLGRAARRSITSVAVALLLAICALSGTAHSAPEAAARAPRIHLAGLTQSGPFAITDPVSYYFRELLEFEKVKGPDADATGRQIVRTSVLSLDGANQSASFQSAAGPPDLFPIRGRFTYQNGRTGIDFDGRKTRSAVPGARDWAFGSVTGSLQRRGEQYLVIVFLNVSTSTTAPTTYRAKYVAVKSAATTD